MLWKANIDIQFVAELLLALAHCGCVTKAEKSSMQEIWQEVSENEHLWAALAYVAREWPVRGCCLATISLKSPEWVDVSMP